MLQYTWLALETILRATSFSQFELAPWSYNTLCARNQITISHLISSTNKATDRIVWSTNLQAHKNVFREITKCSEPSTWAIWVSCCAWYFEVFLLDTKSKFLAAFSFERSIGVMYFEQSKQLLTLLHISMVSCQKGPTRHAYARQIGPFWQDTLDMRCLGPVLLLGAVARQWQGDFWWQLCSHGQLYFALVATILWYI